MTTEEPELSYEQMRDRIRANACDLHPTCIECPAYMVHNCSRHHFEASQRRGDTEHLRRVYYQLERFNVFGRA